MFSLINKVTVMISGIPIQWIPKIELYYPDLPQFPIMYLHSFCGNQRVMGFPVSVSYQITGKTCTAEFLVLTNIADSPAIQKHLENEIKERIGLSQVISKNDVISFCKGNTEYIDFFSELWKYIEASYGSLIPFGRFYEEIYSIVRFVSAWTPKTGRQSEMRMLYNFMSEFGEQAELPLEWSYLECYFIPTLPDLRNGRLNLFKKFDRMFTAVEKVFNNQFTININDPTKAAVFSKHSFNVLPKAWPSNKDDFIKQITHPLYNEGILNISERNDIDALVDVFNRHPWRASFFISAIIVAKHDDYYSWDKQFFKDFYTNGSLLKGYSEKVIACFLQQGFLKDEFIPIDTWIETFYSFPLGIESREDFYNAFDHLGKLERIIWLSSQANKTNMKNFYDILWCQRYGTIGNRTLRGINPISCAECALKFKCAGLKKYLDSKVFLTQEIDDTVRLKAKNAGATFICVLEKYNKENNDSINSNHDRYVPKKIEKKTISTKGKKWYWELIDEFSGYIMNEALAPALINKGVISVREFIDNYKDTTFKK